MNLERWLELDGVVILISLLVAAALWMQVNVVGGTAQTRTFHDIPLTVQDVPSGTVVTLLDPEAVSVTVRGQRDLMREVRADDFTASVDLSTTTLQGPQEDLRIPLDVATPRGVELVGVMPQQARLVLETIEEKVVPVEITVESALINGRTVGEPVFEPAEAVIVGASSRVDRVVWLRGELSVEAAVGSTLRAEVSLTAVNRAGEEVDDVEITPPYATVTVPLDEPLEVRDVPVLVDLAGQPAAGYRVSSVRVSPALVSLEGVASRLDPVEVVRVGPIDVEGRNERMEVAVPVVVPDGITPEPGAVEITVWIDADPD